MTKIKHESIDKVGMTVAYNFMNKLDGAKISNFNIIDFLVEPGATSMKDCHEVKEYWFVTKGSGSLKLGDKEPFPIKEGELHFFDSNVPHQITNLSNDENLKILSIWW